MYIYCNQPVKYFRLASSSNKNFVSNLVIMLVAPSIPYNKLIPSLVLPSNASYLYIFFSRMLSLRQTKQLFKNGDVVLMFKHLQERMGQPRSAGSPDHESIWIALATSAVYTVAQFLRQTVELPRELSCGCRHQEFCYDLECYSCVFLITFRPPHITFSDSNDINAQCIPLATI